MFESTILSIYQIEYYNGTAERIISKTYLHISYHEDRQSGIGVVGLVGTPIPPV